MINLQKFIKRFLILINHSFDWYLNKKRKKTFSILFNLRSILFSLPSRVIFKNDEYIFSDLSNKNLKRVTTIPSHANIAYSNGLVKRAQYMENVYSLNLINFKKGDLVFDCGANVGDLKLWFEYKNIDVNYVGFEPGPNEYKSLIKNIYPSIAHNIGLWNCNEKVEFFISSAFGDSSFIKPQKFTKKITIPSKRLDKFINLKIKLLKVEAEGAEPEIIEGIGDKLDLIEYISADLGFERNLESTFAPVTNYLLERNFEVINIYPSRVSVLFRNKSYK